LAKKQRDLFLISRDKKQIEAVSKQIADKYRVTVKHMAVDLTDAQSLAELIKSLSLIRVDTLINNAGLGDFDDFADANPNKLEEIINLNILALVKLTKGLLPQMLKQESARILNVASIAAFFPGPKMAVYYASKAFVLSFSEALSMELKDSNVSVTVLCPGPTATKFADAAHASKSNVFKDSSRLASAEQVVTYGIKAMEAGKLIALPGGWTQKISVQLPRVLPRRFVTKSVAAIQARKN